MAHEPLTGLFAERYLIERELGHGASAVVYLAHDNKQDRQIALKVLSKDLAHALGPQRFLQEIHVTSRLHNPHILPIFDSGEWRGLLYYVLPFVRGQTLRERLDAEKQLPIEECIRVACEVADALSHAHAHGVIHRDVKPENIMLSEGHALLADFGIARTLDLHTGERLTSSGLIVGTSAYMSPEQAAGDEKIDARSDVYSLGLVLYEMIAGVQPFTGPTTQSVIAQRFKHKPRPVSTYRPEVPEYLERVLEKALAISPADRYLKIKDFAADLPEVPSAGRDRRRSPLKRAVFGKEKAFGFAAAALAALTAAFVAVNPPGHWKSPFARQVAMDSARVMVLPYDNAGPVKQADIDAAMALHRALAKWSGLSLVDPAVVRDEIRANTDLPVQDAVELARKFGAANLIRINSTLDATMYDVHSGAPVSDVSGEELKKQPDPYGQATTALLRLPNLPKSAAGGDGFTSSLPAWRAYGRAHSALAQWRIADAKREFTFAVATDPSFEPARLWKAVVNEWTNPADTMSWKNDAMRAASVQTRLAPRERALAASLAALAKRDFSAACAGYSRLTATDSLDAIAWYGLGDCQAMDEEVIPWAASPSRLRFRSSFRAALDAYTHAFRIEPRMYGLISYNKLQRLLPISSTAIRIGGANFVSYPSLDHDTLTFVPYTRAAFSALPVGSMLLHRRTLERNLQALFDIVRDWTRATPGSSNAYEALGDVLEARGEIAPDQSPAVSAEGAVARAIQLATNPTQRTRLAATRIRLRIRRGEFAEANVLADSLLGAQQKADPQASAELIGVASALGHVAETARLLALARPSAVPLFVGDVEVPNQVREVAALFSAHSAAGDCERAKELEAELETRLQSYVSENDRKDFRAHILFRPLILLGDCTGERSALGVEGSAGRTVAMQQAFARGNRSAVKAMFDTLSLIRRSERPGDLGLDYTYQEAWLHAAMGDTAAAVHQLDLALGALSTLTAATLRDFAGAASLGRAMVFRAELANAMHDRATARKFAVGVGALWAHPDRELLPAKTRMQAVAAGSR